MPRWPNWTRRRPSKAESVGSSPTRGNLFFYYRNITTSAPGGTGEMSDGGGGGAGAAPPDTVTDSELARVMREVHWTETGEAHMAREDARSGTRWGRGLEDTPMTPTKQMRTALPRSPLQAAMSPRYAQEPEGVWLARMSHLWGNPRRGAAPEFVPPSYGVAAALTPYGAAAAAAASNPTPGNRIAAEREAARYRKSRPINLLGEDFPACILCLSVMGDCDCHTNLETQMQWVQAQMDEKDAAELQHALDMSEFDEQALTMFYVQNVIKGLSEMEVSKRNLPLLAAVDRAEAWRVGYDDDDDRKYYYNWRTGVKVWGDPPAIYREVKLRRDRIRYKFTEDQLWNALQTDQGICTNCGFASKGSVPGVGADDWESCTCPGLHSHVSMLKF
jgi:hypothetical protein